LNAAMPPRNAEGSAFPARILHQLVEAVPRLRRGIASPWCLRDRTGQAAEPQTAPSFWFVMTTKSPKELAFLQDLYVATDWGERFAELVDEHVKLPKEGSALYLAAGTGEHAMILQQRAGKKLKFLCVDESDECLELARAKAAAISEKPRFQRENLAALSLRDDQFDLVLGDASMQAPTQLPEVVAEMVRVGKPGATVACWLPTASSFAEFFSIYWEALLSADLQDHGIDVETLITEEPTVSEAEAMAERAGLENVNSWTAIEEFDFESGEQFLNSPLIADFLMKNWLRSLPEVAQERVTRELARIIDEERHEGEFALTVKATLVVGKKS